MAYLKRTPVSTGKRGCWTYSCWVKRNKLNAPTGSIQGLIGNSAADNFIRWNDDGNGDEIRFKNTDQSIYWQNAQRDPNAWLHIVLSCDVNVANEDNRARLWINGRRIEERRQGEVTKGSITWRLNDEGYAMVINGTGVDTQRGTHQMCDLYWVDGLSLEPEDFAYIKRGTGTVSMGSTINPEFRSGQWRPKLPQIVKKFVEARGGFGANGGYYPLNDSTNIGADHHCDYDTSIFSLNNKLAQPKVGIAATSSGVGIAYTDVIQDHITSSKISELPFDGAVKLGGDGTSSSLKISDHADLELGSNSFTMEMWLYPMDTSGSNFGCLVSKGVSFQLYWKNATQNLDLYVSNNGSDYNMINAGTTYAGSVPIGEWIHVAVVRSGDVWSIYTNGQRSYGPVTAAGTIHNNGNDLAIGDYSGSYSTYELDGLVSDFRLVNGTAVYTDNFDPPTTRLTNITNTKVLCCQSTTSATEAAVSPVTITTGGGVDTFATTNEITGCCTLAIPGNVGVVTDLSHIIRGSGTAIPLTLNGAVGVTTASNHYGSAINFDGTDDYIEISASDMGTTRSYGNKPWTWEFWMKRRTSTAPVSYRGVIDAYSGGTGYNNADWQGFLIDASNRVQFYFGNQGGGGYAAMTATTIGAVDEWHHYAVVCTGNNQVDQQGSSKTKVDIYVDGQLGNSQWLSKTNWGGSTILRIGHQNSGERWLDGYLCDIRLYNGVAKYKGNFDCPKPYAPLGETIGIATGRVISDVPTNQFASMVPIIGYAPQSGANSSGSASIVTYDYGCLKTSNSASAGNAPSMWTTTNIGISTGKWYWEVRADSNSKVGISKGICRQKLETSWGSGGYVHAPIGYNGNGSAGIGKTVSAGISSGSFPGYNNNIIGVAVSCDSGINNVVMEFWRDGVPAGKLSGIAATSPGVEWFPTKMTNSSGTGNGQTYNYGQNPSFSDGQAITTLYSDENGYGQFKYQPPAGYLALCTENLPDPVIANPGEHFKAMSYTPDGSAAFSVTGIGFTPGLVVVKSRMYAEDWQWNDHVRGTQLSVQSNAQSAQSAQTNGLLSFDSDGFTVGALSDYSFNGDHLVSYCWKAGDTITGNNKGTLSSLTSVNKTAGFSIVSYEGDGVNLRTIGHGLQKKPDFIIIKNVDISQSWPTYHKATANTIADATDVVYLDLDTVGTVDNVRGVDGDTFTVSSWSGNNGSGNTHIAYVWSEIEGYSKFDKYPGNGQADGPFVYCGFRPAFVLIKCITAASTSWRVYDDVLTPLNAKDDSLLVNSNIVESTYDQPFDFLSNGFKIRSTGSWHNSAEEEYIFAAFASQPFKYSNAHE